MFFILSLFIIVPIVLGIYIMKYEDPRKDLGGFGGRK